MWGSNLATVLKTENKLDSVSYKNGVLSMVGSVLGNIAFVEYDFGYNDKLITVTIYYYHENYTGDEAIDEFNRIKYTLIDKYGAAKYNNEDWSNDTYKYIPAKLGLALKLEHVKLETMWENNRTLILEHMRSDNDNVTIYINYVSKDYMNIKKSKERNEI